MKKIALGKNKINARTARIRQLNDELRIRTRLPKRKDRRRWLVGSGAEKIGNIVAAASAFDDWNEGDNPYGEHDFGKLDVDGEAVIFKIDYYSLDELHGSEHPDDPGVTIRVLTLMFAEDY
ncbi:DUF3768 domain-containing protein [Sinorhizobium meliloti]|uniref:DUF3768 domain-containing protein n=1 Tax=Rhizobium meliloti TaxID=382 RepID=UPI001865970F|nr:DUF3768 domain-containing protein [Sinorhizobium meliloti]